MNKKYKILWLVILSMQVLFSNAQEIKDSLKVNKIEAVIVESRRHVKGDTLAPGLKMSGKLIQIPQNIISINSNLMKMQGTFEVQDALRNISGMYTAGANSDGNIFSNIYNLNVRGFSGVGTFRNGLPSGGGTVSQEDVALIEQIDVVKGPAGFINTMGPAGGAINVNTKAPRDSSLLDATITVGRFNFYRAAIDLGSALKEKGFSFRFNSAYETQHYYFDYAKRRKLVIAPVVQYNFSKNTSLLAEWNMIQGRSMYGSQFGKEETEKTLQKDRWKANYLADPGLPTTKLDEHYGRLVFKHAIDSNWSITSQSSVKNTPFNQWTLQAGAGKYGFPKFDEAGNSTRAAFWYERKYLTYNSQLFVNGKYQISDKIKHHIVAGIDYNNDRLIKDQSVGAKSFAFNRNTLNYGINRDSLMVMDPKETYHYYTRNQTIGAYLYNTFSYNDKLFIDVGARYSKNNMDRRTVSPIENDTVNYKAHSFNPRVGATYMVKNDLAVYVTYDQSFEPQAGVDNDGNAWKPLQSYNTEVGIKKDWFNGQLSTSISAYKIIRNNAFSYDLVADELKQVNQARNKGIEVDIIGSPSKNLTLTANYSLINSVYSKDEYTPDMVGKRFASVPKHQANAWVMYSFTEGKLNGFSFGLGETAVMGRATDVDGVDLPDFVKLDGTIMYHRSRWYVRATLDNITNKRYIVHGTASDRYNEDYSEIIGQTWTYQESVPFNFKVQLGIRF